MVKMKKCIFGILFCCSSLFTMPSVIAQTTGKTVSGIVVDQKGDPLSGANIGIKGTTINKSSNFDGTFSISVSSEKTQMLIVSFIGYISKEVPIKDQKLRIVLNEDSKQLKEVVIQVGYGSVKKKDATGSIVKLAAKDFNKGAVVAVDQLIQGRISGVQVTNGGGSPGEGAQIRIRSGASLFANNDPLYIIDGVPVDNGGGGVKGGRSPLATINQNDIENITVLKDASATAIYGVRASNGVIIITTKKGSKGGIKVSYNGTYSVANITKTVDVLSGDQLREFVKNSPDATAGQVGLLGTENTDWQSQIFRQAFGTDQNISASGGTENLTYRMSLGYSNYDGILKRDNYQRTTMSLNLIGDFLDKHLFLELTNKTTISKNNYSNGGAIGAAISMDPTQPVYDPTSPYEYFQWLDKKSPPYANGNPRLYNLVGATNPLAMIEQTNKFGHSFRSVGNLKLDYKMHFLPELKATANIGYDRMSGSSNGYRDENYAGNPVSDKGVVDTGIYYGTEEKINNNLDLFLNYNKTFNGINTNLDVTGGYNYQDFRYPYESYSTIGGIGVVTKSEDRLNLQAFFGRANITIADKYLITSTFRADATSRFTEENRWGYFPSGAFAWKIQNENFLKDNNVISELKPRVSWGITGQQNVGGLYPALALYLPGQNTASYQFGYNADGTPNFVTTLRPQPYNPYLQWEETETLDFGLDFGFFNNRITGSFDAYRRETTKLLNNVPLPQGVGFTNYDNYNIGTLLNKGVEFSADVYPISNKVTKWRIGGNITFQNSEITQLSLVNDPKYQGVNTGGISGAIGNTVQNHQVGYAPYTFLVFEQAYSKDGKPVEGVYVDRNNDGLVNSDDLYRAHKPAPDVFYGFNTDVSYYNWSFSINFRGSWGNYNYNNVDSSRAFGESVLSINDALFNATPNLLETGFNKAQYLSDYYVQSAAFLKADNATIGYLFKDVFGENSTMQVNGTVQNIFTITDYKGIDPETYGIDNNLYPRPRTFLIGINAQF
jgi:TonB-linked SusC/RagA family outer membrane protein